MCAARCGRSWRYYSCRDLWLLFPRRWFIVVVTVKKLFSYYYDTQQDAHHEDTQNLLQIVFWFSEEC
jgi:hypothetical protein